MNFLIFIIIVTGGILCFLSLKKWREAFQVSKWKKIKLDYIHTDIKRTEELALYAKQYRYHPIVEYGYSIDGNTYKGNRISIDRKREWSYYQEKTETALDKMSALDSCFVNPNNLSEAYLYNKFMFKSRSHYLALFVSGFILIALGIFFVQIRL